MVTVAIKPPVPAKNPRVSFVIPPDIKEALESLANQDHRSISNYVLKLILEDIDAAKRDGRLKGD